MTPVVPNCYDDDRQCRHFKGFKFDGENPFPICKAFPDGIPEEIAYGDNRHEKPVKGQIGDYVFTQVVSHVVKVKD